MANKRERQAGIRDLISSRAVESQEELRRLLKQRGWAVTQSTLSRDLREMRVARVPAPGGTVRYALTGATTDDRPPLEALLPHLYTEIGGVGEMVVFTHCPAARSRSASRSTPRNGRRSSAPSPATTPCSSSAAPPPRASASRTASAPSPARR